MARYCDNTNLTLITVIRSAVERIVGDERLSAGASNSQLAQSGWCVEARTDIPVAAHSRGNLVYIQMGS